VRERMSELAERPPLEKRGRATEMRDLMHASRPDMS
jgi:hypothetical protein